MGESNRYRVSDFGFDPTAALTHVIGRENVRIPTLFRYPLSRLSRNSSELARESTVARDNAHAGIYPQKLLAHN
jgi:hypothetical protein